MSFKREKPDPAKLVPKNAASANVPHLLRVAEVAEALGLRIPTIYLWIAQRRLPVVRLGRRSVRIPLDAVAQLIHENTTPVREEASRVR